MMYTQPVKPKRKKESPRQPTTLSTPESAVKLKPLLTVVLLPDGLWGIDREPLDEMLAAGIQYQALVTITRQMIAATNELVDLVIETRLATEADIKPVMKQPGGVQ